MRPTDTLLFDGIERLRRLKIEKRNSKIETLMIANKRNCSSLIHETILEIKLSPLYLSLSFLIEIRGILLPECNYHITTSF